MFNINHRGSYCVPIMVHAAYFYNNKVTVTYNHAFPILIFILRKVNRLSDFSKLRSWWADTLGMDKSNLRM